MRELFIHKANVDMMFGKEDRSAQRDAGTVMLTKAILQKSRSRRIDPAIKSGLGDVPSTS